MHDPFYDLVPRPPEPPWERRRVALITIDLQYSDAHRDGLAGRPAKAKGMEDTLEPRWQAIDAILPNVHRVQDAFRAAGQEVIHVRVAYRTKDGRDAGERAHTPKAELQAPQSDDRDYEFLPEVAPIGDEMIFNKTTASALNSSDLEGVLRRMGISHVILTGIVTDGCVELTARDAADRGFGVTIVTDGTSAPSPEAHVDAIQRLTDGGFIVAKASDEVIDSVTRLGAQDAVPAGS